MGGIGDVFQYASYIPGARLIKLSPPTADGKVTELCCSDFPEFATADIQGYDISFDAKSIVFAGRLSDSDHYGLYLLTLDDKGNVVGSPAEIPTNPDQDYVYPIFAPQGRIIFVSNENVEASDGSKQFHDEYERGLTSQLGSIGIDGMNEVLGPRNLSHRTQPSMLSDGRVLFTQWDHLGDENAGHLMIVNPDFTGLREAFGKEGKAGDINSVVKGQEVAPGRLVAIGTSRDRTLQSGKIIDVYLGETVDGVWRQSEAHSHMIDMTPLVPSGREPSTATIGRYYDAYPVTGPDGKYGTKPAYLATWADGPVEESTLAMAGLSADFGVYLYDSSTGSRLPLFNDEAKWDVEPRPLMSRQAPPAIDPATPNQYSTTSVLMGSLDVTNSTLATIAKGQAIKVRAIEGFSTEEGIPNMFGLTEHDGAALLGEADVFGDSSWAALVPSNVPVHLQPIDKFGMAIVNEPIWISGKAGESRFCGGCHEDRATTTVIQPGITQALAQAPINFDRARNLRMSMDFSRAAVSGVPWDKALQPIFDAKCIGCHDGDPNKPGNKSLTFTDTTDPNAVPLTFVFNLKGDMLPDSYNFGSEMMMSAYSYSHLSLLGPMTGRLTELGITVTGDMPNYVNPGDASHSLLFQKLNPPQLYPYDKNVRFEPGQGIHPADVGGQELTEDEYYLLILMSDMGGQYFSRENAPGATYP